MELLLAAVAGGLFVWLIVWRNRPAVTSADSSTPPRARSSGPGFFTWLLIIAAGIGGVFYLGNLTSHTQPSEASNWNTPATSDPYDQTGCSASRRAVEAKLRSPGSAKWVSCRVTTEAGTQTVILAVDSQNASGGLVRSEWMTKVRSNDVQSITQTR